ncbi:hypothetical protein BDV96DRAFT_592470 [Lophiotrema nucula]|uniref:Uncharacterized protein n=1 Tax=Lophiotrema nucula TaxID=690887 RepID=A0A6A5YEX7_9PLEO|nr:hypothetical protein BDV96DRAFT_592470 [Lophiotrema nucula]
MSMTFVWDGELGEPKKENDWHLFKNPCWPQAIATSNPGYVLLNEDDWYNTGGDAAGRATRKTERSLWVSEPSDELKAAAASRIPPRRMRRAPLLEEDELVGRDFNVTRHIEDGENESIQCRSADCEKERTTLNEEEITAIFALPEELRRSVPERNEDAIPTATSKKKWIAPVELRRDVSHELPVATGVS